MPSREAAARLAADRASHNPRALAPSSASCPGGCGHQSTGTIPRSAKAVSVALRSDAALIANIVGVVLFVIGADVTKAPSAVNALEQLDVAGAKFAGAVLNRVKLDKNPYYYADHYRREYKSYYVPASS